MDDAGDQHAVQLFVIENDVLGVLMSPAARCKFIGFAAKARIAGEKLKAPDHANPIFLRLGVAEYLKTVKEHLKQVSIGVFRKSILTHSSTHAP
jgi:hypothetical protein